MKSDSSFGKEFKEFISRGNVVDMAVGVVIGGAFTAIVNSLVSDIIMPLVGMITGGVNFTDLKIVFKPGTEEIAEVAILYGKFIQNIVNFLIVAFAMFMVVKAINAMRRKKEEEEAAPAPEPEPEPEPSPAPDIVLLTEIRDLLRK